MAPVLQAPNIQNPPLTRQRVVAEFRSRAPELAQSSDDEILTHVGKEYPAIIRQLQEAGDTDAARFRMTDSQVISGVQSKPADISRLVPGGKELMAGYTPGSGGGLAPEAILAAAPQVAPKPLWKPDLSYQSPTPSPALAGMGDVRKNEVPSVAPQLAGAAPQVLGPPKSAATSAPVAPTPVSAAPQTVQAAKPSPVAPAPAVAARPAPAAVPQVAAVPKAPEPAPSVQMEAAAAPAVAPSTREPVVPAEGWNKSVTPVPEETVGSATPAAASATVQPAPAPAPPSAPTSPVQPAAALSTLPTADPVFAQDAGNLRANLAGGEARNAQSAKLTFDLADPAQKKKPSTLRKVAGAAAGIGAGLLTANPLAGVGAYKLITDAPERKRQTEGKARLAGFKTQDEADAKLATGYNTLLDADTSDYGNRVNQRGQDITAANSQRTAETARIGDASKVIEVPLGDGRVQKKQYNPATQSYDQNVGQPEPQKVGDIGVPVTPAMIVKHPDLKGVPQITQSTWTQLQQEERLGKTDKNEIKSAFELWHKQHPDEPVENWFKIQPDRSIIERMGPDAYIAAMAELAYEQSKARGRATGGEVSADLPPEFSRALQHATATISSPLKKRSYINMVNIANEEGNIEDVKASIRQAAIEGEPPAVQKQVTGRLDTIAALKQADKLLKDMTAAGVPTSLLAGGWENLIQSLGKTTNPKYIEFGSQAARLLNSYTNTVSGAQFSEPEAARYAKLFPTYSKEPPVNAALIKGMLDSMGLENKNYWVRKLGSEADARAVGALDGGTAAASGTSEKRVQMPDGKIEVFDASGKHLRTEGQK